MRHWRGVHAYLVVGVEEDVDGFQVSVDDSLLMNVSQTFDDLPEHAPHSLHVRVQPLI